jgi:hypothetical protein
MDEEHNEIGIPENLRIKRQYTLSPSALAQRQAISKLPKPGMIGNRNAWKHGEYAQGFIINKIKPCRSTCPQYPCDLVDEGATKPGGDCLDKAEIVHAFMAIMKAIKNKDYDDFQEIAALKIAGAMQVVGNLIEDIMRDGTIVKSEKWDKEGCLLGYEIKPHPALLALPKMIAELGLTPSEMMITPKAIAKKDTEEEGIKTLSELMSRVGQNIKEKQQTKNDDAGND